MLHLPLTKYHLLAAKQEPDKKAYLLTKNLEEIFWEKKSGEWANWWKKRQDKAMGVGRTRKEIVKWNQMTARRFQTGGVLRHPWPPFGERDVQ